MKGFCAALFFLLTFNFLSAQQIININDESLSLRNSRTVVQEQVINDFLGKSEFAREFDFNSALKSLTKKNEGDILLLDFFEEKRYQSVIQNVTHYNNGTIGVTTKIDGTDFDYCYISVSNSGIAFHAELLESQETFLTARKGEKTFLGCYKTAVIKEKELPYQGILPPPSPTRASESESETEFRSVRAIALGKEKLPNSLSACGDADLDAPVYIDILIPYTEAAVQLATSSGGINHLITLSIQRANQVMVNSNTNIIFRLAHSYQTSNKDTNASVALAKLRKPNDSHMDDAHALRKEYEADIVVLFTYVEDVGGMAYILTDERGIPDYAFALINVQQATSIALVHEIGHIMGCAHHKLQGGNALYSYSHGWRGSNSTGKFSTIMTYERFDSEGFFPQIDYFSDPYMEINGSKIGDVTQANNVQTLRRTKLLTSLYSNVINTSLADISLSAGVLSPEFDPNITKYSVEVPNDVLSISITGTPDYDCTNVKNVLNRELNVGTNSILLTAISYDNSVSKNYSITVNREAPYCHSYISHPLFNEEEITATPGNASLNLDMKAEPPIEEKEEFSIITGRTAEVFFNASSDYMVCDSKGRTAASGYAKIRVSESGDYSFSSESIPFSIFNSAIHSARYFVSSNAYFSEENQYELFDSYTVKLNANTDYYFRIYYNSGTISVVEGPGSVYLIANGYPIGTTYTYVAVDRSDNKIKMQSACADFRNLSSGAYTIYGIPYSTTGTTNPTLFIGKKLDEIQQSDCVIPSLSSLDLNITGNVINTFDISSPSKFEGGSICMVSPNSADGSAVFAGETVTLTITSEIGYILEDISAYNTDNPDELINLEGEGETRTFTMPRHGVSVDASFTGTDIQVDVAHIHNPKEVGLKAWTQNEQLHITGLTKGVPWEVYTVSGACIYSGIAESSEANIHLATRGIYIIRSGMCYAKIVY